MVLEAPSPVIDLRAHHLVCMQYYVGKGYSALFTQNMDRVVAHLKLHARQPLIQIVEGCDGLCRSCPHRREGACAKEMIVRAKDDAYVKALDVQMGQRYSYQLIADRVQQCITRAVFNRICANCEWFAMCTSIRNG